MNLSNDSYQLLVGAQHSFYRTDDKFFIYNLQFCNRYYAIVWFYDFRVQSSQSDVLFEKWFDGNQMKKTFKSRIHSRHLPSVYRRTLPGFLSKRSPRNVTHPFPYIADISSDLLTRLPAFFSTPFHPFLLEHNPTNHAVTLPSIVLP